MDRPDGSTQVAGRARPTCLVVIVGTGTEVGKTWVSAHLVGEWRRRGATVAVRKPAQSFRSDEGATDAEVLGASSGEAADVVCPPHRWYPVPMAPPMAAAVLGLDPPTLAALVAELSWPAGVDVGLVETAGGLRSPLADDADAVSLVRALRPDRVLLVADAGLGTVNAVRLCAGALAAGPGADTGPPPVVVLNRFDPSDDLHRRNLEWLGDRDGLVVTPATPDGLAALARDLLGGPGARSAAP
ncbi:MAG TPA: dethiobiotin synthase [Acidimicrobiales bacterium]|nr:dethiobiotin synthase [Acidimicrobiales bacterium]